MKYVLFIAILLHPIIEPAYYPQYTKSDTFVIYFSHFPVI